MANTATFSSATMGNLDESMTLTGVTIVDGPPVERFRKGGPKECRLNRVRLMDTGRYYDAAIARGEKPGDLESMHSLRIGNLPMLTSEDQLRREFEVFGPLGDAYRPIDKDTKKPKAFVFIRFLYREHMINAMNALNGKVINGRPMRLSEAKPGRFNLETSVY